MLNLTPSGPPTRIRPPALRVAPLERGQLAAVTTIYREHLRTGLGSFEDPLPDEAEMARRLAAVEASQLPALVVLDDRGLVRGFSWARPWRERAGYRGTVEDSIYVARAARRQGIGRLLLGHLVDACGALGCRRMIAVVGDARNRPSIRLHESLGFEACGLLPGAGWRPGPDGGMVEQDVLLLQRKLGAPAITGRA